MQLAGRPPGNQCYLVIIRCNLRVITAVTTLEYFWNVMWLKKQWPRWCLQVFIVTLLDVGDINLILWIISDQASRQKLGTLLRSHVRQNRNRDGGGWACGRGCGEAQASEIWRNDEVSFCNQPLLYFDINFLDMKWPHLFAAKTTTLTPTPILASTRKCWRMR